MEKLEKVEVGYNGEHREEALFMIMEIAIDRLKEIGVDEDKLEREFEVYNN